MSQTETQEARQEEETRIRRGHEARVGHNTWGEQQRTGRRGQQIHARALLFTTQKTDITDTQPLLYTFTQTSDVYRHTIITVYIYKDDRHIDTNSLLCTLTKTDVYRHITTTMIYYTVGRYQQAHHHCVKLRTRQICTDTRTHHRSTVTQTTDANNLPHHESTNLHNVFQIPFPLLKMSPYLL